MIQLFRPTLIVISLVLTLISGLTGRCPLWVPLLLTDAALLA